MQGPNISIMSQIARSRKLVSQLSTRYFLYRMRTLNNCQFSIENAKRARFQKDNDESDRRESINETCEDDNNNAFYNDDGEKDDSEFYDNIINNVNVCGVVVDDINIYEIENDEVENDFTTSHFAKWCKTLNVPMTHVNALLKDISEKT